MTVGQLRSTMSAAEMRMWMAYHRIEPIGMYRGDLRAGLVASTIANANRGKNTKPFNPLDFMPIQKQQREADTETQQQELDAQLLAFFKTQARKQ